MTWDLWTFVFGLVGALGVLIPPMLWLARRIRSLSVFSDPRFSHFLDDWFGEAPRPGFGGRPGMPERIAAVEELTKQLRPNGGSHLADKIARLEQASRSRASDAELLARIDQLLATRATTTVTNVLHPLDPGGGS